MPMCFRVRKVCQCNSKKSSVRSAASSNPISSVALELACSARNVISFPHLSAASTEPAASTKATSVYISIPMSLRSLVCFSCDILSPCFHFVICVSETPRRFASFFCSHSKVFSASVTKAPFSLLSFFFDASSISRSSHHASLSMKLTKADGAALKQNNSCFGTDQGTGFQLLFSRQERIGEGNAVLCPVGAVQKNSGRKRECHGRFCCDLASGKLSRPTHSLTHFHSLCKVTSLLSYLYCDTQRTQNPPVLSTLGVRLPLPAPAQINEKQWFTRLDDWMALRCRKRRGFSIDVFVKS